MGLLVDGQWHDQWYDTDKTDGKFVREDSQFRNSISSDGSTPYPPEAGRYHLYISLACPWASRAYLFRKLKNLEKIVGLSIVDPHMAENGWIFSDNPGCIHDTVNNFEFLHQVYTKTNPDYSGRVTVPVLFDKQTQQIVNNESSEIIRMFNTEFNALGATDDDFYPEPLRAEIDEINDFVYDRINNGVYKCGFATAQDVYEENFDLLFDALDQLEDRLASQRYLVRNTLTEADWRLFMTLIRFDCVYHGHFKTNLKRIEDYPNLSNYVRDLYQYPGVSDTVNFDHIKQHYYKSQTTINPTKVVPKGPTLNYTRAHDRGRFDTK